MMKEQLLNLSCFSWFHCVAGQLPILFAIRSSRCRRGNQDPLTLMACHILAHLDWEQDGAKALFSEDGIWTIIPQSDGKYAFMETMYWKDNLGIGFGGIALGVLPERFVYSRLHEQDAIALINELVHPPSDLQPIRFQLFGADGQDDVLSNE